MKVSGKWHTDNAFPTNIYPKAGQHHLYMHASVNMHDECESVHSIVFRNGKPTQQRKIVVSKIP